MMSRLRETTISYRARAVHYDSFSSRHWQSLPQYSQ
jgi:hypothetical protein